MRKFWVAQRGVSPRMFLGYTVGCAGRERAREPVNGARTCMAAMGWSLWTAVRWLDDNIERWIILAAYLSMSGIIFVEVIRRFVFQLQAPWSSTVPIYLFLFITWFGASYNTRKRSHLSFKEFRRKMPYMAQFACLLFDGVLWIVFGTIVAWYALEQVILVKDNFAVVAGTGDLPLWWFYVSTPVAWALLILRAVQNLWDDCVAFYRREPLPVDVSALDEQEG